MVAVRADNDTITSAPVNLADLRTFTATYGELFPKVMQVVNIPLGQPAQAEEVAQEVFLEVWKKAADFDSSLGTPATWIFMIARRRAVDRVRSEQRQGIRTQPTFTDADQSVDDCGVQILNQDLLALPLAKLLPTQRAAIELFYYQGMTFQEVSDHLGIPLGTAKSRVRLGLHHLRNSLAGWDQVASGF